MCRKSLTKILPILIVIGFGTGCYAPIRESAHPLDSSLEIPTTLKASISGFGPWYAVKLSGTKIEYEFRHDRGEPNETISFNPTPSEWKQFDSLLSEADVWNWQAEYIDETLADGQQWRLKISAGNKTKIAQGSNQYPPADQFEKFLQAIRVLIDGNYFQ